MEVINRCKEITAKLLNCDEVEITEFTDIRKDLAVDSSTFIDIVLSIETTFSIEISDFEVDSIRTFQDLCNFVQTKLQK